jgi:hypothetical protein
MAPVSISISASLLEQIPELEIYLFSLIGPYFSSCSNDNTFCFFGDVRPSLRLSSTISDNISDSAVTSRRLRLGRSSEGGNEEREVRLGRSSELEDEDRKERLGLSSEVGDEEREVRLGLSSEVGDEERGVRLGRSSEGGNEERGVRLGRSSEERGLWSDAALRASENFLSLRSAKSLPPSAFQLSPSAFGLLPSAFGLLPSVFSLKLLGFLFSSMLS